MDIDIKLRRMERTLRDIEGRLDRIESGLGLPDPAAMIERAQEIVTAIEGSVAASIASIKETEASIAAMLASIPSLPAAAPAEGVESGGVTSPAALVGGA